MSQKLFFKADILLCPQCGWAIIKDSASCRNPNCPTNKKIIKSLKRIILSVD